jgi:hypothetical protein
MSNFRRWIGSELIVVTIVFGACTGAEDVKVITEPPPAATWTFCSAAGVPCEFLGLRDVRLVGPDGSYVQQTAYASIPCATYGFNDQNPAPGKELHCEYGPQKMAVLTNPMPGMGGLAASVTVPLGSFGADTERVGPQSEAPTSVDGSGAFRTTCDLAKFAFDDPIVYPGQPGASHLHAFFGNTTINPNSTPQSIAASGASTCRGGTLNRTGYWVPALFDSRSGEVQTPAAGVFYYKTGYGIDPTVVEPFPVGLRMIAGNRLATAPQDYVEWDCRDHITGNTGSIPVSCPIGDAVRLAILFPQCWDGVHLDSPDHKSHMAYPIYRNPPELSTCPSTHPVTLPAITEHFDYAITQQSAPAYWRLSSDLYSTALKGGFSAHADWMNGWDPTTMKTIVTQCLNKGLDCGVGSIGNGTDLY